jgi:NAD(P)-dependent dehydrogenase (short-subunit alcohol dehydrogenase family)
MADRSVLITGGTGGLGGAVVDAFAAHGWRVVAPVRGSASLSGPDVVTVPGIDLSDPEAVATAVAVAADDPDAPLRAVVNTVGGYAGGANVHEMDPTDFERQFALNLRPAFLLARAALPRLMNAGSAARGGAGGTGGGAIVLVASRAALVPFAGASGYIASKAALVAFAQAVAVEYRDAGVRCNTVLPSVIDTPANRAAQPDADHARWVPPAQIAEVIRFLADDQSAPTTGAAIPVYGRA